MNKHFKSNQKYWAKTGLLGMMIWMALPHTNARAEFEGVIYLKNGNSIRGELMEMLPEQKATIHLADGSNREFMWAEIDHIESTDGSLLAGGSVRVQFRTPEGSSQVEIKEFIEKHGYWKTICLTPCKARLTPGKHRIQMAGNSLSSTRKDFVFQPGNSVVTAYPGSGASVGIGIGLLALGELSFLVGGIMSLVGIASSSSKSGTSKNQGEKLVNIGLPVLLGGAVGMSGLG
jgi:hypothetical protein